MSDRFSRWLGRDRTDSARTRVRSARRIVAIEALEGRVLLSGVDHGDFYLYNGGQVPLNRATDQVLVGLKAGQTKVAIDRMTAEGGPLAGATAKPTANGSLWVIQLPGEVAEDKLATLIAASAADPSVDYATTAFASPTSDYRMWATRDVVVALREGVDPATYFAKPSFASFRRLLGTTDQFVATTTAAPGPETLALANQLSAEPQVQWVSPDFYKPMQYQSTNDPLLGQQWHLNNTGQTQGKAGADARVFGAWDLGATGQGVIIAILDSGVDIDHEDLRANIFVNPGEIPGNGIDDDGNGYADDVNGWNFGTNSNNPRSANEPHGTAVTGVAAAVGNNATGVAGAAYRATILPATLGDVPLSGSSLAAAVYYASGRNASGVGFWSGAASVLNHSYGGPQPDAVEAAAFLWSSINGRNGKGAVNLAATGNNSSATVSYPAAYPGTIAVGASTDGDLRASYSQYGPEIDFLAPSGGGNADVTTTDVSGSGGYDPGNYTTTFSGTSSATPLAVGVTAQVLGANPNLTYTEVVNLLRSTAAKIGGVPYDASGFNIEYGYGRIDATRAVTEAQARLLKVDAIAFSATEAVRFDGNVAEVRVGTQVVSPASLTATINWGDGQVSSGTVVKVGVRFFVRGQHTFGEGGPYNVTTTIVQANGNTASASTIVNVVGLPLNASGTTIVLQEGATFAGVLAHFVDTSSIPQTAGHYAAVINFGDGTNGAGSIVANPSGGFDVFDQSGHAYGGGSYNVTVTITDPGTVNNPVIAITSANVADSALTAVGLTVAPLEGIAFPGAMATFTDADPRVPPLSNYFATIDYGDGTFSNGTIQANPFGPGFIVVGDHPYGVGSYPVVVTVGNFSGGSTSVALTTAEVADAPLFGQGFDFKPSAGVSFKGILAAFTDADPRLNPVAHYQASVDWGDGTRESGVIVVNIDGGYLVKGTHAYRAGNFTITTTISDVGGSTVVTTGQAVVPDAPVTLTLDTRYAPGEGTAPTNFPFVAFFTTPNLLAVATDFAAVVDYGDGTTENAVITASPQPGSFQVGTSKLYDKAGTYPINVVLTSPGGSQIQTSGSVTVTAAPISVAPVAIVGQSKTQISGLTVATFTSANPKALASAYSATISWGDGTTSVGTVAATGLGGFVVLGDHIFAEGGTFSVVVSIVGSGVGAAIASPASIADTLFPISGGATSAPGGVISATGLTNSATPVFTGTSEPFATVSIFKTAAEGGAAVMVASGKADGLVNYAILSTPMLDGRYTITASAIDARGNPSSAATVLYPTAARGFLTVDTQGPKVTNARLEPRSGRVTISLADGLSGLGAGVLQATIGNFTLQAPNGRRFGVTGLTVSPVAPNTQQTVTLTFATAKPLARGKYVLTIRAAGVGDMAGNGLDERFFVPFPGLYNSLGQDFVAAFQTDGRTVSQPIQFIPPREVVAARRHGLFVRRNFRRG